MATCSVCGFRNAVLCIIYLISGWFRSGFGFYCGWLGLARIYLCYRKAGHSILKDVERWGCCMLYAEDCEIWAASLTKIFPFHYTSPYWIMFLVFSPSTALLSSSPQGVNEDFFWWLGTLKSELKTVVFRSYKMLIKSQERHFHLLLLLLSVYLSISLGRLC